MPNLKINYADGKSEAIENVYEAIDHGDGEISFFIGSGFTRYHAFEVANFEIVNNEQAE
ncbi:hypothetical protein [Pantoea cypripedii]|uniref:hypothetical protein n=1 Tax=Pantoea cypripedii TaxID=55209 RepID=UPI001ABFB2CC|nr:hypothetical protein [Pantoea cypripedii]